MNISDISGHGASQSIDAVWSAGTPVKSLTDDALWESTIIEVQVERSSTLKVISLLTEINSRKLHLRRGYGSLHEYCVRVLKYSDGGADRRIKAMRLVEDLPETRESIKEGHLNLTTASQHEDWEKM